MSMDARETTIELSTPFAMVCVLSSIWPGFLSSFDQYFQTDVCLNGFVLH